MKTHRPAPSRRPRSPSSPAAARPLLSPLPALHPAALIATGVAAACILATITFRIFEPDFWQHLLVGRAIWQLHAVPTRQLWSWPTYGAPDVNSSWGFRALVWPLWSTLGVAGLALWRWATTFAAFGLLWLTGRRMGARGFAPLLVLVACALVYRERAQIRPESLVSVLMALQLWILERTRHPGTEAGERDLTPLLILVAWIWINVHLSYFIGFLVLGIHLVDESLAGSRAQRPASGAPGPRTRALGLIALAALAISFVNPFGWRALWQPIEFALFRQHELINRNILEMRPVDWSLNLRNLLPALMLGWPVLAIWRTRRHGIDRVEAMTLVLFTALPLRSARFVGFYALYAAPYLARDLDEWVRSRAWPALALTPWARAALVSAACVAIAIPEWSKPGLEFGIGIDYSKYPVAACDFIATHGVRGHGFNKFELGGYQAYRFWPDRERLPFMDVHQAGTPADQELYARSLGIQTAWEDLDARYRFDYALLTQNEGEVGSRREIDRVVDYLDSDTTWALVLLDDASRLYVRRQGPMRAVARQYGCGVLPGGRRQIAGVVAAADSDTTLRDALLADLRRQVTLSPWNSSANSVMSFIEERAGRPGPAREHMLAALRVRPTIPRAHEWLGRIALDAGDPREALREFEIERARHRPEVPIDYWTGVAYQRLGDRDHARDYYRRAIARDPGNQAAADSLASLERAGG